MHVFTAITTMLLLVETLANSSFRFENGVRSFSCPVQDDPMIPVHLPHERDCGKFLKCFNGRAFTIDCPPGQDFGVQFQRCDYPAIAQCRSTVAEPYPMESLMDGSRSHARCTRNDDPMRPVHLAHRDSCQKFMKCLGGQMFELECPTGQEWAADLNRCDYPSVAKCTIPETIGGAMN